MFCHNCGTKLEDGSKFCPECGARQETEPVLQTYADVEEDEIEITEKKTRNKGVVFLVLIIFIGVLAGVGGFFGYKMLTKPEAKVVSEQGKDTDNEESKTVGEKTADEEETADTEETDDDIEPYEEGDPIEVVHEYEVVTQRMTWQEAADYCEDRGGYLATVTSEEEYNQIVGIANNSSVKVLWLGGKRTAGSDEFVWVNGEPMSYSNWASGEPNNDGGTENCLGLMLVNGSWQMYDLPEDVSPYYGASKVGFVMEKEIEQ